MNYSGWVKLVGRFKKRKKERKKKRKEKELLQKNTDYNSLKKKIIKNPFSADGTERACSFKILKELTFSDLAKKQRFFCIYIYFF